MKLLDILNEVEEKSSINASNDVETLSEAKKRAKRGMKRKIKKTYDRKRDRAMKIARKLRPRKNKVNWTKEVEETRNQIVSAFMQNDPESVIKMMTRPDGYIAVEVLKALETAHGGYKRLERKSGDKKKFVRTVYAYIDELEDQED